MHPPQGFVEQGKTRCRQRQQLRLLNLGEDLDHLLSRGAVNPQVGDFRFPLQQMLILFGQRDKREALERIALHILHAAFDLPLVPGRAQARRQDHRAVVLGERPHLRTQLRIEPVRLLHRRAKIVDDERFGDPAEVGEGVLQATQKVIGALPEHRLGVRLAAVTEHDPKHPGAPPLSIDTNNGRPPAEVHLHSCPASTSIRRIGKGSAAASFFTRRRTL